MARNFCLFFRVETTKKMMSSRAEFGEKRKASLKFAKTPTAPPSLSLYLSCLSLSFSRIALDHELCPLARIRRDDRSPGTAEAGQQQQQQRRRRSSSVNSRLQAIIPTPPRGLCRRRRGMGEFGGGRTRSDLSRCAQTSTIGGCDERGATEFELASLLERKSVVDGLPCFFFFLWTS